MLSAGAETAAGTSFAFAFLVGAGVGGTAVAVGPSCGTSGVDDSGIVGLGVSVGVSVDAEVAVGSGDSVGLGEGVLPELPVLVWALTTPLAAGPDAAGVPVGVSSFFVGVEVVVGCVGASAVVPDDGVDAVLAEVPAGFDDWLLEVVAGPSSAAATP
ncbi:hypothetical protein [Mycobacterium sp. NPDC006124]|uniref:hypothetical protein n=1 Tax=Mycobacterium sp. NPDC006124 TaxID=3156729 RepID=UPI0033B737A8